MNIITFLTTLALLITQASGDNTPSLAASFTCLVSSAGVGVTDENPYGVVFETFGFLLEGNLTEIIANMCGESPETCDLRGTELYTNATAACDAFPDDAVLVEGDLDICSDAIKQVGNITTGPAPPDVSFKNVPVCLAKSCGEDADIFAMLKVVLGSGSLGALNLDAIQPFEVIFDEEVCPDEMTSGGSRNIGGPSIITSSLALAAAVLFM